MTVASITIVRIIIVIRVFWTKKTNESAKMGGESTGRGEVEQERRLAIV